MADENEKPQQMVVCILENDKGEFSLPRKINDKLGAQKRNGVGGKVEEGESIVEAARRETLEEAGVTVNEMIEMGTLEVKSPGFFIELHIFHAMGLSGEPSEQKGQGMGEFKWFKKDELPFDEMWPNDKLWYPYLIEGKHFQGKFELDKEGQVLSHEIQIVDLRDNDFKMR